MPAVTELAEAETVLPIPSPTPCRGRRCCVNKSGIGMFGTRRGIKGGEADTHISADGRGA